MTERNLPPLHGGYTGAAKEPRPQSTPPGPPPKGPGGGSKPFLTTEERFEQAVLTAHDQGALDALAMLDKVRRQSWRTRLLSILTFRRSDISVTRWVILDQMTGPRIPWKDADD